MVVKGLNALSLKTLSVSGTLISSFLSPGLNVCAGCRQSSRDAKVQIMFMKDCSFRGNDITKKR